MPASCVPLVVRSHYSLCRGTAGLDALLARALSLGYPALALTDRDNLYGAIHFHRKAGAAGVRPILGAEVSARVEGGGAGAPGGTGAPGGAASPARAVCLVRTMDGYAALCRILTRRMLDVDFALAPALREAGDGLHILTDDEDLARSLHPALPPHRLWLLLAHPMPRPEAWRRLARLSRELGRGLVASPDVMYLDEDDRVLHRTLSAVRERALVTQAGGEAGAAPARHAMPGAAAPPRHAPPPSGTPPAIPLAPPGSHLPQPAAFLAAFRDFSGALVANRLLWEDAASFELTLGKPIFPRYPLPAGETAYSFLFRRCLEGMRRRYGGLDPAAMRRLTYELEVIDRLGFPEYFVIVGDICRFAHDSGIPTVGRGSGAGSIVAYLLGITNVDPLRYRLYFERFLHEKRRDLPDLDIDLCWRRRDDVINHVYRTYGADRVAMISTHNTFQARGAFRDVARAHGVAPETVDRWCRALPHYSDAPIAESLRTSPRARDIPLDDPRVRRIVEEAQGILGAPRHLGIHPGGIVIGDRPLDTYVPLEEATKGIVVTQYEMRAVEAIGLVKIDLLGNRAISIISETVRLIGESEGRTIDPAEIKDGDEAAAALMAAGDTLGVFQLESPGMRNLLRMLGTRDLDGAIAALSLIRPGPAGSGMKERFIRRARGLEPAAVPDPRLAEHLRGTRGVLLYEEDVMQVGATLAGLSLAEGDMLRRAIGGIRSEAEAAEIGRTFIGRAIRSGTPVPVAEAVWKQLRQFAAYAFCKAHAAGYGVLAYQEAYLKAHHPAAFAVAILNNHVAMYEPRVHLEDARRHGVPIRLPCVNRSGAEFSLEMEEGGGAGAGPTPRGAIRIGLGRVRLLAETTIARILAERERRPFAGLDDFLRRVHAPEREVENLILAGAFDFTGRIRPEMLCELRMTAVAHARAARAGATGTEGMLFDPPPVLQRAPGLADFDRERRHHYEFEVMELSADFHPMGLFRAEGLLPSRDLAAHAGRRVRMAGLVAARRRVVTKRGEPMFFLTLDDEDGLFECTMFPPVYRKFGGVVRDRGPYVVTGRAEEQYGAVTVTVEGVGRWGEDG